MFPCPGELENDQEHGFRTSLSWSAPAQASPGGAGSALYQERPRPMMTSSGDRGRHWKKSPSGRSRR